MMLFSAIFVIITSWSPSAYHDMFIRYTLPTWNAASILFRFNHS